MMLPTSGSRLIVRVLSAAALLLALQSGVHGQRKLLFEHLTVKQGLSQGDVMSIFQDSDGFMWFGTQDGINRFDGYGFRVFKQDPAEARTLNGSIIVSIAEDRNRTLWIGTRENQKSLNRFDRLTETFTQVPVDSVDLTGGRAGDSRAVCLDSYGVRWAGADPIGKGLTCVDTKTDKRTTYRNEPANAKSLIDDRVYSVFCDHLGTVWITTHEGLDRFDRESGTFVHYTHDENNPGSLSDNWVWPICEDRSGTLWVGTFRGGLDRLDRATGTFTRYRHDESDPRSLSDDRIYSIYQDRSGIIWVGTGEQGVDRFDPELAAFQQYEHEASNSASLVNDNILSIYLDRSGVPWIGTRAGLDRFDRTTETFRHFRHVSSDPRSIADNQVQSMLEDRAGEFWLGTGTNGLDRLDREKGVFTHFRHDPKNPRSLSDDRVYALCEDHAGALWVGTYGGGLNRFDRGTGAFAVYAHNDSVPGSLGGAGAWALCEDHEGTLWVGTFGGGLDRFNRESETFTHYKHDEADPGSLSNDIVVCLCEDHTGALWVGTVGGLNCLDRTTGKFRHYRERDGLANDMIFGILEDNRGNLWMSTNKGISKLDAQRGAFRNFDYSDGLQGNEFNQGAYARDGKTGEMYFGGGNGFNVFHPDSVRDNSFVPPVVFSAFSRYNTDDKEGKPIEERGINAKSTITLSYKDNVANFEFAALSYHNTFKNQYAYRLEGFSDNWIQLGSNRRATFTNLDGGDYTLRVRGSNNDGIWNEQGASLRITVTPPWWKTRWAYGTYALILLCSLYGLRRFEINRQAQKTQVRESELRAKAAESEKRALEAENARQTKELEDARRLQLSLLPREVPVGPDYEIAVFMKTATEVGGDYYDFSTAPDRSLNIAIGDATGHGMQAGTIVTLMKGLFVSDASRFEIQAFFNHCSRAIKDIRLGRLFMAFTLVRLNGDRLSLSSAGMPPVYLYRQNDGSVEEILLKGMPLGAMKNFPYVLHEADLHQGDAILLLTDGLPEQKDATGEMFDYARVQNAFAGVGAENAQDILSSLVNNANDWLKGGSPDDDITLLVIKKKGNRHPQESVAWTSDTKERQRGEGTG